MAATDPYKVFEEGSYSNIYNKGIEGKTIFNDDQDYQVFTGYLGEYLSPPADPNTTKKAFKVNGREYKGIPHQPKNYFNKIELIAYSLKPESYHLLLRQIDQGSVELLMRSLITRYSMYFNKKYKHTGAVFGGPYRISSIKDDTDLTETIRNFHSQSGYSSHPEYSGKRTSSWIKPENYQDSAKESVLLPKTPEPRQDAQEPLERIPEKIVEPLERIIPASREEIKPAKQQLKSPARIPEFIGLTLGFLILFALGLRNIEVSAKKENFIPGPTPAVIGVETEAVPAPIPTPLNPSPIPSAAATVTVKISDGSKTINIRTGPTIYSPIVGVAQNGNVFEFVSKSSGFYEVKLDGTSTGFISAKYIEKESLN